MDYNKLHAERAMEEFSVRNKSVLVVGCNIGKDCSYFVNAGAREVHGLDVESNIGSEYQHARVRYFRQSAENMSLNSNRYDLVYAVATMEHVPDIQAAFKEMARVTKRGGGIYCLASPLWNSRQGHHLGQYFPDEPWIHLRKTQSEVLEYLNANEVAIDPANQSREVVSAYMYDKRNFNMIASSHYIEVCQDLDKFHIIRNDLDCDGPETLPQEIKDELARRGYTERELLAVTHTFIGRKKGALRISGLKLKLRRWFSSLRLPSMRPAVFVVLNRFPRVKKFLKRVISARQA